MGFPWLVNGDDPNHLLTGMILQVCWGLRYTLFSREGFTFKVNEEVYENFEVRKSSIFPMAKELFVKQLGEDKSWFCVLFGDVFLWILPKANHY